MRHLFSIRGRENLIPKMSRSPGLVPAAVSLLAQACLFFMIFANTASAAVVNTWVSWTAQATQMLTKSNAGTMTQNGSPISVGWETRPGLLNVGVPSGTINTGRSWSIFSGTNHFGTGTNQSPSGSLRIGFDTDNTLGGPYLASNPQKITFSTAVINPYVYLMYIHKDVLYDFSKYKPTLIDSANITFSNGVLTSGANDLPNTSAIIQLMGVFTQITFNINALSGTTEKASSELTIAAPLTATAPPPAPVPEPTSMAIFGLAAMGMAYRSRRTAKGRA